MPAPSCSARPTCTELAFGITSYEPRVLRGSSAEPYDPDASRRLVGAGPAVALAARISAGTGSAPIPAAPRAYRPRSPAPWVPALGQETADPSGATTAPGVLPISHTRDTIGPMARTVAGVGAPRRASSPARRQSTSPTSRACGSVSRRACGRASIPGRRGDGTRRAEAHATPASCSSTSTSSVSGVDEGALVPDRTARAVGGHPRPISRPRASTEVTLGDIAAQAASPDVRVHARRRHGRRVRRPLCRRGRRQAARLQALYARYFAEHRLDALLFPTTPLPAVPIDLERGSSFISIDGGLPIDTFSAFVHQHRPGEQRRRSRASRCTRACRRQGCRVGVELGRTARQRPSAARDRHGDRGGARTSAGPGAVARHGTIRLTVVAARVAPCAGSRAPAG